MSTETIDVRSDVVSWGRWCVEHKGDFQYLEVRPMPLSTTPTPLVDDCSGTVTLCFALAGAPDPNGNDYEGTAYEGGGDRETLAFTGTLVEHGTEISLAEVLPGDVVVYGPGTGVHCALVIEGGTDPLTMSHGQPSEPAYVFLSEGCPSTGFVDGAPFYRFFRYPTTKTIEVPDPPAPAPKPAPAPAPTKEETVTTTTVSVKIGADGQGETPTEVATSSLVAVSPSFGVGPKQKGAVGWTDNGGKVMVSAYGWEPDDTVSVLVAYTD